MAEGERRPDQPFLYDAFISYRHVDRDRKWAEWLIAALEGYRVPKSLQDKGLPPRLHKIFRDEDEVPASSDLNDQIREALIASRFLIVVCSAFTPRSKWVEREIQIFNELGRGDQVLALLTEGEPSDSFPEAMLVRHREVIDPDGNKRIVKEDKEPLAADVRSRPDASTDKLKRLALLRLVAVIIGVKFDDLRQREQERERKRRATWAAIAAALVLLVGVGGGIYWDMMRPKTAFYRQLVWRWGLPEGVGKIDATTHGHLARSYSVVTQHGKVVEVTHDGWLRAEADGFHRWVVHYGDNGSAQKIEIFDATRRLVREEVLRREASGIKMIVSLERDNIPLAQAAMQNLITDPTDTSPAPDQPKSDITRHELTFDDNGFATEVRYQDNWGTPEHDAQGSFGEHFSYSPEGLVLRSTEIGPNGEDITLRSGVRAVASSYDDESRLLRLTLLGEDGRPINGPDGYAYYQRVYDSRGNGNDTAQTYYAADGKPTLNSRGYFKLVGYFDERGNNIEVAFYGVDGKPTPNKNGVASVKRKFDDRSNVIEMAFFDVNGQPTYDTSGRAGVRQTFNEHGNIIEVDYYGVDGKPTISKEGFAKISRKFDERGNLTEEAYFGVDGKPLFSKSGYASVRQAFDTRDQKIEVVNLDGKGKLTLNKEAIARITYAYDSRGNEIERSFFGIDGKPTLGIGGFAVSRQSFDDRGHRTEFALFDTGGKPALNKEGLARAIYRYDARGNETERSFFGVDGKPTLVTAGFAIMRQTFDDHGRVIDTQTFGLDGKLKATPEGIAHAVHVFDTRGNEIERDFFGVDGSATLGTYGYASFRQKFDDRGNVIEIAYFGLDGKPTLSLQGFAGFRQAFDDRHQLIELSYFDADGEPTLSREHIAKIRYAYDARGNEIERAFFGVDGKRLLATAGFAGIRTAYDARGNKIELLYFGVDGEPTLHDRGYTKITWTDDTRGNLIEESYFGIDGKLANDDGCVTIRYSYDDQSQQTKVTYLDSEGRELEMEVVIRGVIPGGTAARAGFTVGDHILTYNGVKVGSIKQLSDLTGGAVTFRAVTVRRGSQIITLKVLSGNLGAFLGLARVNP
jgi:hypothetical protein